MSLLKSFSIGVVGLIAPLLAIATQCQSKQDLLLTAGCEIVADVSYGAVIGSNGQPEYGRVTLKGYTASSDTTLSLRNMVIVVSGFDPTAQMSTNQWLATFNQNGLADRLRNNGYDVVVMNYGLHSGDYIQDSGLAMVRSLQVLQAYRPAAQPAVIVGLSEGGLIARYALSYMEFNNISHNVRTYISYDTPHQGANVPVGLQHLPHYLSTAFNAAHDEAQDITNKASFAILGLSFFSAPSDPFHLTQGALSYGAYYVYNLGIGASLQLSDAASAASNINQVLLNAPAAKQQLINYYQSNGSNPLRTQLMSELGSLGSYPKKLRKVAFSNGSANGVTRGISPGTTLLSYSGSAANDTGVSLDLNLQVWATKTQPAPGRTFSGTLTGPHAIVTFECPVGTVLGVCPVGEVPEVSIVRRTYDVENYSATPGYKEIDGVPGSFAPDVAQFVTNFNRQSGGFGIMTASNPYTTFIPTYSALDLDLSKFGNSASANFVQVAQSSLNVSDLSKLTPFSKVYYPSTGWNEGHLDMLPQESEQLYTEITTRYDLAWLPTIINMVLQ